MSRIEKISRREQIANMSDAERAALFAQRRAEGKKEMADYRASVNQLIEEIEADPTISLAQKEYTIAKLREDLKTGPVQDSCV